MHSTALPHRSLIERRRISTARARAIALRGANVTGSLPLSSAEVVSDWVLRWADVVTVGPVLDLGCGPGRHAVVFADRGLQVVAVDRDRQVIPGVQFVQADLEGGAWPFAGQRFAAIV